MKLHVAVSILLLLGCVSFVMGGPVLCSYCQLAIGAIEKDLAAGDVTEAEAIDKLKSMCASLPTQRDAFLCKTAVALKGPHYIDELLAGEPPLYFCGEIGFCNATAPPHSTPTGNGGVTKLCQTCQTVVGVAEEDVKNLNITSEQVVARLDVVCDALLSNRSALEVGLCKTAVGAVVPKFVEQLQNGTEPLQVCKEVLLCRPPDAPPLPPLSNITACGACSAIVGVLQRKLIASGLSSRQIVQLLLPVCDKLPEKDQGPCRVGLRIAAPKYIKQLLGGVEPNVFCGEFKLCPHEPTIVEIDRLKNDYFTPDDCVMCDVIAEFMATRLPSDETRFSADQLRALFPTLCVDAGLGARLDAPYGRACNRFLERFGLMLVSGLRAGKQPHQLCPWLPMIRCQ